MKKRKNNFFKNILEEILKELFDMYLSGDYEDLEFLFGCITSLVEWFKDMF